MSDTDPTTKAQAIQYAHQQPYPSRTDPQIEAIMTSLFLQDSDVSRILKGEFQEPMNKLQKITVQCIQHKQISYDQGLEILAYLQEINRKLSRYYNKVPYILSLSPMMKLSNITEKEAQAIYDRQELMVLTDKANRVDDEDNYEDDNWYTAILNLMFVTGRCSVNGFMIKQLVEEKKTVSTIIEDRSAKKKGRFF